jgi:hypothetical protein
MDGRYVAQNIYDDPSALSSWAAKWTFANG